MSLLFQPLALRGLELRNRVWVSPMCQYSAVDGLPNDWHLVHLGARALGGAGLVLTEATAVTPEGRISPRDTGLWSDAHVEAFAPITSYVRARGAASGVQLAHAGRKASVEPPWLGGAPVPAEDGGWTPVAPSAVPYDDGWLRPRALSTTELAGIVEAFAAAAGRALAAGFDVVEIHAAHGYLLHQFLSPLSNERTDEYGGGLDGRLRFPLEVVAAVRAVWPEDRPLFVRLSATDWVEGGWDLESSIELARRLRGLGVDLVDVSSGGLSPAQRLAVGPGYQLPFAAAIRREAGIATGAVGLITEPEQAESILAEEEADAVLLGRALLRDPSWPLHAAEALGDDVEWPVQYERARPRTPAAR